MLSLAAQSLALYGTQEALSNCFLGGWMNGWSCVRVDEEAVRSTKGVHRHQEVEL